MTSVRWNASCPKQFCPAKVRNRVVAPRRQRQRRPRRRPVPIRPPSCRVGRTARISAISRSSWNWMMTKATPTAIPASICNPKSHRRLHSGRATSHGRCHENWNLTIPIRNRNRILSSRRTQPKRESRCELQKQPRRKNRRRFVPTSREEIRAGRCTSVRPCRRPIRMPRSSACAECTELTFCHPSKTSRQSSSSPTSTIFSTITNQNRRRTKTRHPNLRQPTPSRLSMRLPSFIATSSSRRRWKPTASSCRLSTWNGSSKSPTAICVRGPPTGDRCSSAAWCSPARFGTI
mmetsp:Transcript_16767/g.46969  ORF Transcript_16767/g.46969 Transcript_16767/m.46969 type:complete len:291 (+) Transcript_16767:860-1732(+)